VGASAGRSEYRLESAEADLCVVFAETGTEFKDLEVMRDGTRLGTRFTLLVLNRGNAPATHLQASFSFPSPPFQFQSPMSYQTGSALPDEYWLFDSNEAGLRLRFHGRGDFVCHISGSLELATLPLTTTSDMAGQSYRILYQIAGLNAAAKSGVLTLRVHRLPSH